MSLKNPDVSESEPTEFSNVHVPDSYEFDGNEPRVCGVRTGFDFAIGRRAVGAVID
ncbi:hypothetical protein [Haladaptatus halobius]|uniref:hypothetical protein n=1 Tax=Haladaptatus halobius TaxID=2884875 RepID=UPI001D0BDA1D|nr:hypothetical protein [Haladaptatus halobius]